MITKEVRLWLQKLERKQYSYYDAMEEFIRFSPFLTIDEMNMIKHKIKENYK